ncbi:protein translocase subunit SecD [Oceanirhabdus sp. W0125-5]|uniref:protein translocase subunit SecD n=1 Tax=Oceanirhabdus sp. W0125-5 TaxID=2999116 RepID=UPI0022F31536|nr:protein translocase subunit SecD [Oceanirhabdus sp. W0125-5]WBW99533.1 protein translocase subunit SecD [Oceanirhabdus sp. W0125-5]
MKKGKGTLIFLIIVLFVGIFSFASFKGLTVFNTYRFKPVSESIGKGLDLVGGISVIESVQDYNVSDEEVQKYKESNPDESVATIRRTLEESAMARTKELIEMRVNKLGISETVVARDGEDRIRIEIPGVYDSEEVINLVGKTGQLKFVGPDGETILTGENVERAIARRNDIGQPLVSLSLNKEGAVKFEEATKKFLNQRISIYLDEDEIVSPIVSSVISDGEAVINQIESESRASSIANLINSGALPVTLKIESYDTVGATLGENAVPLSTKAGMIGILIIMAFMIIYYRVPGVISSIALLLFVVLDMNIFASLGGVLTLAGIAGLLLTIGMAVDANVLIFERIKEEIKLGKSPRTALEAGYSRALISIVDANVTTLIAALILYFIGTGAVKGFALTLLIGIAVSMFTALVFTKYMLKLGMSIGILKKPGHFGVKRG